MKSDPQEVEYNWATEEYLPVEVNSFLKVSKKDIWNNLGLIIGESYDEELLIKGNVSKITKQHKINNLILYLITNETECNQ